MCPSSKVIKIISLIGTCALAVMTARAVSPPPDGAYPGDNTAEGDSALFSLNTSLGTDNTAIGFRALFNTTTGTQNTATGSIALVGNTSGGSNTANGFAALGNNITGSNNTASGGNALQNNTTGTNNTANGFFALINNTTGGGNIALGSAAGLNITTGNNNIDIGNNGVTGDSQITRIGTPGNQNITFISGIREVPITGIAVGITADGQLGVRGSSARFKEAIRPMEQKSEVILALQPVTFRYKKELDPKGIPQFGLVAEQVAKVDPDLVANDDQGKPFTVRYEEVNAMLLNEFLKEHIGVQDLKKTVTKQEAMIAQQQTEIQALTATLKAQAAQIQKVSDQVEASKVAPRLVADSQ